MKNWVYVAHHIEFNFPIAASYDWDKLIDVLDDYFGPEAKRLAWYPYDCKYPDDYQGYFEYKDYDEEIVKVKVYTVDFK
jgi:hypothetical protein